MSYFPRCISFTGPLNILPSKAENDDVMNDVTLTARIKNVFQRVVQVFTTFNAQIWHEVTNDCADPKYSSKLKPKHL